MAIKIKLTFVRAKITGIFPTKAPNYMVNIVTKRTSRPKIIKGTPILLPSLSLLTDSHSVQVIQNPASEADLAYVLKI